MTWQGVITVQVSTEFEFTIDEGWEATSAESARRMVEGELTDYLGEPFVSERFDEHWKVEEYG